MNLLEHLETAQKSIFRFEYLQEFLVPGEETSLKRFEETGEVDVSDMGEWWSFLKSLHAKGVRTERVRLVREPQTRYTTCELLVHKKSVEQGDDIRVLKEKDLTPDLERLGDFWLVDDKIVLRMNYSPSGEYLGFEEVADTASYVAAREYLWAHALPLA